MACGSKSRPFVVGRRNYWSSRYRCRPQGGHTLDETSIGEDRVLVARIPALRPPRVAIGCMDTRFCCLSQGQCIRGLKTKILVLLTPMWASCADIGFCCVSHVWCSLLPDRIQDIFVLCPTGLHRSLGSIPLLTLVGCGPAAIGCGILGFLAP